MPRVAKHPEVNGRSPDNARGVAFNAHCEPVEDRRPERNLSGRQVAPPKSLLIER
jgi:hypothetical protein